MIKLLPHHTSDRSSVYLYGCRVDTYSHIHVSVSGRSKCKLRLKIRKTCNKRSHSVRKNVLSFACRMHCSTFLQVHKLRSSLANNCQTSGNRICSSGKSENSCYAA